MTLPRKNQTMQIVRFGDDAPQLHEQFRVPESSAEHFEFPQLVADTLSMLQTHDIITQEMAEHGRRKVIDLLEDAWTAHQDAVLGGGELEE